MQLSGTPWLVTALVQDIDVTTDRLMWYRKQQLNNAGINVVIKNLSNASQIQNVISLQPSHVVYIPAGLEYEATPHSSAYWGSHMTGFTALLQGLKCSTFIMVSQSLRSGDSHMTIQQAHMTSFEAVLLAYHNLHNLRYTIIRTGPVYGPWTQNSLTLGTNNHIPENSWYISDVTDAIFAVLHKNPFCNQIDLTQCNLSVNLISEHKELNSLQQKSVETVISLQQKSVISSQKKSVENGLKRTLRWVKSYQRQVMEDSNNSNNDVILTSYFTSQQDFQRNKSMCPNRLRYMFDWLVSVRDMGLRAVVFHDQLDPGFCQRVVDYYPGIRFQQVSSPLTRTTNDARFYAYLDYIHSHSDINHVLLTDISDVKFQRNPFNLMQLLGDWLYIGTDIDIFPNMETQKWITERLQGCFGSHTLMNGPLKQLLYQDTVFNAGVIGGSRHVMQSLLELVISYLNTTPPDLNCNMPAVNFVVHRYFYQQVFTGFPVSSRFLRFQSSPKGIYIVHK